MTVVERGQSIVAADFKAEVLEVEWIQHGVFCIRLHAPEIAKTALPGQFVMVRAEKGLGHLLGRPIAVAGVSGEKIELCVAVVGDGTSLIGASRQGDILTVRGPLGKGFILKPDALIPRGRLIMAAGTLGASPLLYAWRYLSNRGKTRMSFILGVPGSEWLPYIDWLKKRIPSLSLFSDDGAIGKKGNPLDGLPSDLSYGDSIWSCGPEGLLKALSLKFRDSMVDVKISTESRMGCGYGGCLGCPVRTTDGLLRTCSDGPVFPSGKVIWDE